MRSVVDELARYKIYGPRDSEVSQRIQKSIAAQIS
jgi:hypothetical protein